MSLNLVSGCALERDDWLNVYSWRHGYSGFGDVITEKYSTVNNLSDL
jgi:hypothetical protein